MAALDRGGRRMEWHLQGRALPSVLWEHLTATWRDGSVAYVAFVHKGTHSPFMADFRGGGPSFHLQGVSEPWLVLSPLRPRPHHSGTPLPFAPGAFEAPLHRWPLAEQPSRGIPEHAPPSPGRMIDYTVSPSLQYNSACVIWCAW
jgi:hypothetical protein